MTFENLSWCYVWGFVKHSEIFAFGAERTNFYRAGDGWMQLCTLRFLPSFLLLSAFHLNDEGLASTSKYWDLASFCVYFSVDSVVINAKLTGNKLLSKLEELASAQACSVCALMTLWMWSRNHCVTVMAASTSVVLVKGQQRLRGNVKGSLLTSPLRAGLCELVTQ